MTALEAATRIVETYRKREDARKLDAHVTDAFQRAWNDHNLAIQLYAVVVAEEVMRCRATRGA